VAVFNFGADKMMVVFLVALVLLGPDKLPQAAKQWGRVVRVVRRYSDGFREELNSVIQEATGLDPADLDPRNLGAMLTSSERAEQDVHQLSAAATTDDATGSPGRSNGQHRADPTDH